MTVVDACKNSRFILRETPLPILTMRDTLSFASLQISAGALILAQQQDAVYQTRDSVVVVEV